MRQVRQHSPANIMLFLTDSADLTAGKTGLTLVVTISKDGAAFGSISPTVTERGNGWYNVALVAADSDTVGDLAVRATATGAVDGNRLAYVEPEPRMEDCAATGTPTTTTTATASLLAGTAADFWKDSYLRVVTGSAAGQVRKVTASSEAAGTTTLTHDALATAMASADKFVVINR